AALMMWIQLQVS
ncbi:yop s translocation protein L, partial [Vibrio harveyi]